MPAPLNNRTKNKIKKRTKPTTPSSRGEHPSISEEKQALYLLGAIERTWRDWPYVVMLTVWILVNGRPYYDELSGCSLIEPDSTPRLAYEMLSLMEKRP